MASNLASRVEPVYTQLGAEPEYRFWVALLQRALLDSGLCGAELGADSGKGNAARNAEAALLWLADTAKSYLVFNEQSLAYEQINELAFENVMQIICGNSTSSAEFQTKRIRTLARRRLLGEDVTLGSNILDEIVHHRRRVLLRDKKKGRAKQCALFLEL